MISTNLQVAAFIGLLIYFCVIIYLLRKNTISLRYTLTWIFAGVVMAILLICPKIAELIAKIVGMELASNAIFTLILFFILLILMSLTSIVSRLSDNNKQLIQSVAILEKRVRDIEMTISDTKDNNYTKTELNKEDDKK